MSGWIVPLRHDVRLSFLAMSTATLAASSGTPPLPNRRYRRHVHHVALPRVQKPFGDRAMVGTTRQN
jgi:hypothetical protein